jgi:choline-sulfatase
MQPANLLFILSDQHSRNVLGCYGNPHVHTPNLDALAARGTRFESAYTNGPICVPARASLATGRYVHDTGCWDNAAPYDGTPRAWGHELMAAGHHVTCIGKLHYKDADSDTGFDEQLLPLHVVNGTGMLFHVLRDPVPTRPKTRELLVGAGAGDSSYTQYDTQITERAVKWIEDSAAQAQDKPWALMVSLVAPHPPYVAPQQFHARYAEAPLPAPRNASLDTRPDHPALTGLRDFCGLQTPLTSAEDLEVARAYYGLVSFLDDNTGQLIRALERSDLADNTRIVYASDHGESLGNQGLYGKSSFYEESVGVPMIMAGPDIKKGYTARTPVSLLDLYPTFLHAMDLSPNTDGEATPLPGHSLFDLARNEQLQRAVLSEQHSAGMPHAGFMLRHGRWKYVYYAGGLQAQLFDLHNDPDEQIDLAGQPAHADILQKLDVRLRTIVDPDEMDRRAKADQKRRLDLAGGAAAVLGGGSLGYTPAPGEEPEYKH